jgi:hypothetical protein
MLLLFESPAGFALFKVLDEGKLKDVEVREYVFASLFGVSSVHWGGFWFSQRAMVVAANQNPTQRWARVSTC